MAHITDITRLSTKVNRTLFLVAGPCVIEDDDTTLRVASFLKETQDLLEIPIIFKSSYDKANRTSLDSFRGPGIEKGRWRPGHKYERADHGS